MLTKLAFLVVATAIAERSDAALVALGHSVTIDPRERVVTFQIEFNEAPDFFAVDGLRRQTQAFQFYIDSEARPTFAPVSDTDFLVRGPEIFLGDGIPIRDREGDGGPNSGGWGPVRNRVPFLLDQAHLSFDVPLDTFEGMGLDASYYLVITEFSDITFSEFGPIIDLSVNAPKPITSIEHADTGVRLSMPPVFGRTVGVEFSNDMSPGSWIELGNFFEDDGELIFTDPDAQRAAQPRGYYRAFLRPIVP